MSMGETKLYLQFDELPDADRKKLMACLGKLIDPEFRANATPPHLYFPYTAENAAVTKATELRNAFCQKEGIDRSLIRWSLEPPS